MPDVFFPSHERVNLIVDPTQAAARRAAIASVPSWDLTAPQLADLDLLLSGAYAPLAGYTGRSGAQVTAGESSTDAATWPAPVHLDVDAAVASRLMPEGSELVLRDPEGVPLAILHVKDAWQEPDGAQWRLAGPIEGLQRQAHHDFAALRRSAHELRAVLRPTGDERTLALFVDTPLFTALLDEARRTARALDAGLLIVGLVRPTSHGDESHVGLVRAWRAACTTEVGATLCLLPWRGAEDPETERALRARVARNLGCTHIAARSTGGPDKGGRDKGSPERGSPDKGSPDKGSPDKGSTDTHSARRTIEVPLDWHDEVLEELTHRLREGATISSDLAPPAVVDELTRWHPPPRVRGYTVFLTGLSGSGKSTIANILQARLRELDGRPVTLLDGDIVRKHLSSELGFSREHRELNVLRIAYVASEITKNGGAAICAPIAPYDDVRHQARRLVQAHGDFLLVFVDTPLEICEQRDPKGLYAKARAGLLPSFTGISDPYEPPDAAELVLDTTMSSASDAAERIVQLLRARGYLA